MYTYQQVRLAGWLALSSEKILPGMHHLTMVQARQYHLAQKRRLNWWLAQTDDQSCFELLRAVMMSEILTRVWTAMVDGWYQTNEIHGNEARRIFTAVQADHVAAKRRLTGLITQPTELFKISRLTGQCRRWTDVLLGYMNEIPSTEIYGYRRDRIEEHASDVRWQQTSGQGAAARKFINLSLKQRFCKQAEPRLTRNDTLRELNGVCSTAILSCMDRFRVDIPESWIQYCTHPANSEITLAQRLLDQWRRVDRGELHFLN